MTSPEERMREAGGTTREFRPESKATEDRHKATSNGAGAPNPEHGDHGCPLTEDGIAQAFAIGHCDDFRFCHGPNRWHVWDGTRWKPEQTKSPFHEVRMMARAMARTGDKASTRATLGRAAFAAGVEQLASTIAASPSCPTCGPRSNTALAFGKS